MNRSIVLVLVLCAGLALGYGASRVLVQSDEPAAVAEPAPAVPAPSPAKAVTAVPDELLTELGALRREKQELTEKCVELEAALARASEKLATREEPPSAPSPPSRRPVVSVPDPTERRARRRHHFRALDRDGRIGKKIAEELGLTEAQHASANDVIQQKRAALKNLELKHAKVKYASDDEIIITVQPFEEEGAQLRRDLEAGLQAAMSKESYAQFKDSAGAALERDFGTFGKAARDITIKSREQEDGQKRYTITERSGTAPDMSGVSISVGDMVGSSLSASSTGLRSIQMSTATGDGSGSYSRTTHTSEIPEEYRHFLPAGEE